MSKAEANLKSFKISVKAEDLQKALDPAIWPMRVKVREFIHYRRNPGADNQGGQFRHRGQQEREKQPTQQHPSTGHVASGDSGHHGQNNNPGQGQHSQGYAPLAPNRYAMPGDNVPGGGLLQVQPWSLYKKHYVYQVTTQLDLGLGHSNLYRHYHYSQIYCAYKNIFFWIIKIKNIVIQTKLEKHSVQNTTCLSNLPLKKISKGRGKGGLATLWEKSLTKYVSLVKCSNFRLQATKFSFPNGTFLLINTYFPCGPQSANFNENELLNSLMEIRNLLNQEKCVFNLIFQLPLSSPICIHHHHRDLLPGSKFYSVLGEPKSRSKPFNSGN